MMRTRWLQAAAALLAVLVLAPAARPAPVPGKGSALAAVPASSPIVFYLNGAQHTRDRAVALLKNALPDLAPLVESKLDAFLKDGIDGRKLRGVPKDGALFLAFTELPPPGPGAGGPPKMAFIIAVTDYAAFRDGILKEEERKNLKGNGKGVEMTRIEDREDIYFVDRKGYAVVSPNLEAAQEFTKARPGLDTAMSKALATRLLASDGGIYFNVGTITKTYADQIKEAQDQAEKVDYGMLKLLVPTLLWSINDTQAELLTAELRPNALVLHSEAEFRAGSATANALKGMKPSTFKDLGRMPVNQLVYLGMDTSPGMLKALGTCMYDMMGVTQGKAAREAMEEMAQAGASSRVDAMTLPVTGLDVWECKDPARVVTAQLKLWEAMAKSDAFKASSFFKRPRIKLKARKYGDIEFNAVTISWDREKAAARGGKDAGVVQMLVMEGLAKFVFIGQEFTYWFGSDGKSYVQVMAWDWATARKLLDQYFKGKKRVGDVANFHAARKELPAEASFLMLLDASRSAICIQKFLTWWAERLSWGSKSTVEFPDTTPNPTAPFLGLAVTLQPQRGSFDIVLTAPAAKEFYNKVVKPIVRAPGG